MSKAKINEREGVRARRIPHLETNLRTIFRYPRLKQIDRRETIKESNSRRWAQQGQEPIEVKGRI